METNPGIPPEDAVTRRDFLKMSGAAFLSLWLPKSFIQEQGMDLSPTGPLQGVEIMVDHVIHTQSKDLPKNFDSALQHCDAFVPEWESGTPADAQFFNDLSSGKKTPKDIADFRTNNQYFQTLLGHLYKSGKPVFDLDIPQGDPMDNELPGILNLLTPDFSMSYQFHVNTIAMGYGMFADWNRDREKYILKNLYTLVAKLKHDNPVKYASGLKIFMEYGATHQFYETLKGTNKEAKLSQNYPLARFTFLPSDEVLRRYWFGKDYAHPRKNVKLPDDHLFANVVMEELLRDWFYEGNLDKFPDSASANVWFRSVIELFNKNGKNEAKELWELQQVTRGAWANGGQDVPSGELPASFRKVLAQKLKEKGVADAYIQSGLKHVTSTNILAMNPKTFHSNFDVRFA